MTSVLCAGVCVTNQRIHNKSGWFDGWIHTVGQKYSAEALLAAVLAKHHHISFQIVVEMKIVIKKQWQRKKTTPALSLSLSFSVDRHSNIERFFFLSIETESKWFIQVLHFCLSIFIHPFAFSHCSRLGWSKTSVYIHTNTNSLVQTLAFSVHLSFATPKIPV